MSALAVARDFWKDALPEWVEALAQACEATSQNKVARELGYSAPVVSNVLRNRYSGDLDRVEDMVRGKLMDAMRDCPVAGPIRTSACAKWRGKASRPAPTGSSMERRMHRGCQSCPHFSNAGANQPVKPATNGGPTFET